MALQPWGPLDWVIPRLGGRKVDLICGLNPSEDRSLASAEALAAHGVLRSLHVVYVEDPDGHGAQRAQQMMEEVPRIVDSSFRYSLPLLSGLEDIVTLVDAISARVDDAVLFDISTLPKRFFFPIFRSLRAQSLDLFGVVLTEARSYPDGPRRMDPLAARPLPGFEVRGAFRVDNPEVTVIGIGREVLGLYRMLDDEAYRGDVHCLLPFPSNAPAYDHGLDFLAEIRSWIGARLRGTLGIYAPDVPSVYQELKRLTGGSSRRSTLIPYGPKSVSLAMCILASDPGVDEWIDVVYSQPQRYAAQYSQGIAEVAGRVSSSLYLIRVAGRDVYAT